MRFCVNFAVFIAYVEEAGDAINEAIRKEMAKLDRMELKRNHVVLSEDEAAHPDKEEVVALPRGRNELAEDVEDKKEVVGDGTADMKADGGDVANSKLVCECTI